MGSRLLIVALALQGCLVHPDVHDERLAELTAGDDDDDAASDRDGDGFLSPEDCDDLDGAVHPGAAEVAYDGVDNDCDPTSLDDDGDHDGHGSGDDCDDTDAAVHPGVPETYYDGVDNDCDDTTDDDDQDGDGSGVDQDCDDTDPDRSPTFVEEPYDGVDDDCDPNTRDNDLDGDGSNVPTDCDDLAGDVNPGELEEPYDGVDNDCAPQTLDDDLDRDGFVLADDCDDDDDQRHVVQVFYEDLDLDGYGGATLAVGCQGDVVEGAILVGGDCDDGDRGLNPETPWFPDADRDGFGDGAPVEACAPGPDFARLEGDCDDGDDAIFPGAVDPICGDGVSPSCASDVACHDALTGVLSPGPGLDSTRFVGDPAASASGGADLDGDGWPDVVVGVDADGDPSRPGALALFAGPLVGGALGENDAAAAVLGEGPLDRFGARTSIAGDIDGDGFQDLLVAALDQNFVLDTDGDTVPDAGKGAVYLVFGPVQGTVYTANASNVLKFTNPTPERELGDVLAPAGDTDGDGYDDWLVSSGGTGKAWLVRGSAVPAEGDITVVRQTLFDAPERVGTSLGATDHDGDGWSDVLLGVPENPGAVGVPGAAMVVSGADLDVTGATLNPGVHGLRLGGVADGERAGASVAGADLDGDGFGDVVVGAPAHGVSGEGRVYVWYGSNGAISGDISLVTAGTSLLGSAPDGGVGSTLQVLGDVDGVDGVELAVGGADGAATWLVQGGLPRTGGVLQLADAQQAVVLGFEAVPGVVGDLDGDGQGDLLGRVGTEATVLFGDFTE